MPSQRPQSRGRRRPDPLADIFDKEILPMLEAAPGLRPVAIYEEMVLKKPQPTVVQIGSVQQIKTATGPALTSIANAGATQAVNETEEVAAPAGD